MTQSAGASRVERLMRLLLLVISIIAPTLAWAQGGGAAATSAQPDQNRQLDEILKQLESLRRQVEDIRKGAAKTTDTSKPADQVAATPAVPDSALPEDWVKAFRWRSIGPAGMGGRITAISVYEADPTTWWIATASGGLLKTTNNGITFEHQFDREATVSVGDVCVAPSNPDIVWVGTGEGNPRNSVTYGDGVYKSTDGGKKWTNMGLKKTFQIGKVIVHPKNPDVVYVGALGRLYGTNEERGVYKTTDGGKTWERVLYIDDKTGVIDMAMHPTDPNTMIVAMWERQRDLFDSHPGQPAPQDGYDVYDPIKKWGPGSGLHKTTDGGKTWKRLTAGLPSSHLGRMDVDYYLKDPNILYAIIDCATIGKGTPANRTYIGITGRDGGGGAQLTQITAKGPAEKAGLKVGDVIKSVDKQEVKSYAQFTDRLRGKAAGDKLALEIIRDKETLEITATIENRPLGALVTGSSSGYMGIQGEDASDGVLLTDIIEGGPAARAELKDGDIVKSMNKEPATSYELFTEALRSRRPGDKVDLEILRDGKLIPVSVTLDERPTGGFGGGGGGRGGGGGFGGLFALLGAGVENVEGGGVKLTRVGERSVAEKAKLEEGDILTAFDGKGITDGPQLLEMIRERHEGDEVAVKFSRDKETKETKLILEPPGGSQSRPYTFMYGGQAPNVQETQGPNSHEYGGVYRSADGGESWSRVNSINPRPMYFSQVRVDPTDEKYLYVLGVSLHRSKDGGKTFTADGGRNVHADQHALWIDPRDGRHMIVGTDGGFYATWDRMANWEHLNHMAIAQFYHVALDTRQPYRAYGGLQDNGSWGGPSRTLGSTGPLNPDWISVGSGDGFVCRVDPFDPDIVYSESQNGAMSRRNLRTGERAGISPRGQRGQRYRFNWNTPFIVSNHNPGIFYAAGNYVFRSIKRGDELKVISPEIARTGRGTGTALAESPRNPDVLWVGTDDGHLWITKDGGANWKNVAEKVGLPGFRWVATVEPSRYEEGRCYVAFDAHRSDDDEPYVFVTEDFGETWTSLKANLPWGSTRCVREDVRNPNLLVLGTEFAVFASINRGQSWTKINNNLPTVAVHELAIHPTAGEMVAATHGRSLWVLDISPLRQMTTELAKAPAHLFEPNAVVRWRPEPSRANGGGSQYYAGSNPSRSATLAYSLGQKAEKVSLRVVDHTGATVRTLQAKGDAGLNTVAWDLSRQAQPAGGGSGGGPGQGRRGFAGGTAGGGGNRPPRSESGEAPAATANPAASEERSGTEATARSTSATGTPAARPEGGQRGPGRGPGGGAGTGGGRGGGFGGGPVPPGLYRVVLEVDGKEFSQSIRIEADPVVPNAIAVTDEELLDESDGRRARRKELDAAEQVEWISGRFIDD